MANDDLKEHKGEATTSFTTSKPGRFLRAALFFAGSAAFGGLAVALWDRKVLTALRGKEGEPPPAPITPEDETD